MRYELGFGDSSQTIEVEDSRVTDILLPNHVEAAASGEEEVEKALDAPIGSRRLEELAESGFDAAWLSMIEAYFAQSDARGMEPPFERLEYCARKAADAGLAEGHTHLGMLCGSPLYGELDPEGAAREYLLAMEGGSESAARLLLDYWNREFRVESYTPEENRELTAAFHESIREAIRPEIERLSGGSGREALTAFGLLHFYGIYFEQSLDRAKEYFVKLNGMGSPLARRMLENPVFEDDDSDEDDDE